MQPPRLPEGTQNGLFWFLPSVVQLDQINFRLPTNVPAGCYIPVAVRVGTALDRRIDQLQRHLDTGQGDL